MERVKHILLVMCCA